MHTLSKSDNEILDIVLPLLPLNTGFSVQHFINEISDTEYKRIMGNSPASQLLREETTYLANEIERFLLHNDFAIIASATIPIYAGELPLSKTTYILLTDKGKELQFAGSYMLYLKEQAQKKIRVKWDDRIKRWGATGAILVAAIGFIIGVIIFWLKLKGK